MAFAPIHTSFPISTGRLSLVDKKSAEIKQYCGCQVKGIDELDAVFHFVLVATIALHEEIEELLENKGFTDKDYLYLCDNERYLKEDVFYKGCMIGRYTYGYEELLSDYPMASKIGRFCVRSNPYVISNLNRTVIS